MSGRTSSLLLLLLQLQFTICMLIGTVSCSEPENTNSLLVGLKSLFQGCPAVKSPKVTGFVNSLCECVRSRALIAIDRILEEDIVPVLDGFDLVKFKGDGRTSERPVNSSVDQHQQNRKTLERALGKGQSDRIDDDDTDWREKLSRRLARVFKTHVIKIDVDRLRADINNTAGRAAYGQLEGRGRRRRKRGMNMMPIVMMGMLLMGSVLVPMGFQFLAVLGGKALILAKMALMMSSIQGLKKIATSGINYGLYHTGVPEPWHERSNPLELPFDPTTYHSAGDLGHGAPPPVPPGPYFGHYARRVVHT